MFVVTFFIAGCSFEGDLDLLNKFNIKYKSQYILGDLQFFCFDIEGLPYTDGDLLNVNGISYRCDAGESGSTSIWVENIK